MGGATPSRRLRSHQEAGIDEDRSRSGASAGWPGGGFTSPDRALVDEAVAAYAAFLHEAYGLTQREVGIPEAYAGREIDWFGHLNEILHMLDGYDPDEVATILRRPDVRLGEGQTLLSALREGGFKRVHRLVRRM